ncbi:MAG TPA: MFS transporter, partial [Actinomycetes bacterium]|nr:MFS transporter [Actinomycetes bacterium]
VHRALDTTGALAGPLIAFVVLASIPNGFDHIFVLSFAAAVIGLAILVLLVPNLRSQRLPAERPSLRVVAGLAVRPGLRRLLAVAAVLSMLTIGDGFLYLALQRREDFAAKYFPLLFAGTALVYLLLAIPLGRLADRWGAWPSSSAGTSPCLGHTSSRSA